MSDLHAELHSEQLDYAALKKNDIAIVAGDLGPDPATSLAELARIAAAYKTVLFVDGNHEFRKGLPDYAYNFDFDAVEEDLRRGIAKIPNVVYLRDTPFVKDGVAIIGRNGHWDYKMVKGYPRRQAIKDSASILETSFNKAASFSKMARRDYYALRDQIIRFNKDPSIHTIVVVTHTVPRAELLHDGPPVRQTIKGSSQMRHLLQYDANKKVKFWFFGHQHNAKKQEIDGVLYQENPRGHDQQTAKNYKPSAVRLTA